MSSAKAIRSVRVPDVPFEIILHELEDGRFVVDEESLTEFHTWCSSPDTLTEDIKKVKEGIIAFLERGK